MRILGLSESRDWCTQRQIPLRASARPRPDFGRPNFHIAKIPYPKDSGKKVYLARLLYSLISSGPETLLLVDEWDVWPSSQHLPLFTRFRESLGEHRLLEEAPAHIVSAIDKDDAVSVIATSLFFYLGLLWGLVFGS